MAIQRLFVNDAFANEGTCISHITARITCTSYSRANL